jgi:hypothetical protein
VRQSPHVKGCGRELVLCLGYSFAWTYRFHVPNKVWVAVHNFVFHSPISLTESRCLSNKVLMSHCRRILATRPASAGAAVLPVARYGLRWCSAAVMHSTIFGSPIRHCLTKGAGNRETLTWAYTYLRQINLRICVCVCVCVCVWIYLHEAFLKMVLAATMYDTQSQEHLTPISSTEFRTKCRNTPKR